MNSETFRQFVVTYCRHFADTGAWLASQPKASRQSILDAWYRVLRPFSAADLEEAMHKQIAGQAEACPGYNRTLTAAYLRAAVLPITERRRRRLPARRPAAIEPNQFQRPMWQYVLDLERSQAAGESSHDALARILRAERSEKQQRKA